MLKKVATVVAIAATFALGIDGTIAYSQAAVGSSEDECAKPPPKLIKKVAKYSVRKGYVPLTSKILAKVNKTKPKPKVEEPCDTIKPIVAEPVKVDPIKEIIEHLPPVVPETAPAVASVADTLPDHAFVAPIVVSAPTTVVGQSPMYGQWWGGWYASPVYFVSVSHSRPSAIENHKPTHKPTHKPNDFTPVPAPATALLVGLCVLLMVKRACAKL